MERKKFIGGVDFEELRSQRIKVYDTFTIDVTTLTSDREFVVAGNYLYVLDATDIDVSVNVKFNEKMHKSIEIFKGRGIRSPFYRLYFSWAAQAGKIITIAVGTESQSFEILDLGKALEITGAMRLAAASGTPAYGVVSVNDSATLIKAANGDRRSVLIQNHDPANLLYLGYDASVTIANAGGILDYLGAIEFFFTGTIYGIRATGSGNAGYLDEVNP